MATQTPVIKNGSGGAILYTSLISVAAPTIFQANPTLATGDVKISIDGGSFGNLGTLPEVTPAAGKAVKITLSQAETNGDNLVIVFSDAAGAEWCDQFISIQTAARTFNDLAFPVTSGRGMVVDGSGAVDANTITLASNSVSAAALAADAGAEIADAILDRNMATGADNGSTSVRTMRQALRFLRNKWSISGGTLTVTKEDDSTASWTSALTTTGGADPVTASDPAGP